MTKNIWTVYYLILLISCIGLLGLGYAKHSQLYTNLSFKNKADVKLASKSIESSLTENELLLDVLGSRLLENGLYKNKQRAHFLLKQMRTTKPGLAGFGLADIKGNFIAVSGNLEVPNLPNLLELPETREDFQAALNSHNMVIGRTYYFEPINEWIIPLRKALRDEQGNPVAVMTTGVKVEDLNKLVGISKQAETNLTIINARNFYRTFVNGIDLTLFSKVYLEPMSKEARKSVDKNLLNAHLPTLEQVKTKIPNIPISGESIDTLTKEPIVGALIYNSKYDLYIVVKQTLLTTRNDFINAILTYVVLFILFHTVLILLVRRIHINESTARKHLKDQVEHDSLTGLYNRYYLKQAFHQSIPTNATTISLMFIDLDNFKHINDTFGHSTGDQLLIEVSKRLKSFKAHALHIIRFGGDEFIIVMADKSPQDFNIAKQVIETLSVSYLINGMNFTIGASIGIARENADSCNLNTLLSHADLALYEAKNRKNWVEVFTENLQIKSQKVSKIEHNLRTALENNEIYLNYQPQVNKDGKLHGVECLVRWNSKGLGFVPPDEFISVAEDIGMMPILGQHITEMALTEMSVLQKRLNHHFQISINVSIKQFMQDQFFEEFTACIEQSGIPFKYITIEITESLLIEDMDFIFSMLEHFRRKDISISLDDFGTGYSSLSLLRQLPIQELKIDKAFVDDILDDSKDSTLVKNIINIGNEFGMNTLAEGVELKEQLEQLSNFECDLFQGYFFSKPLSLDDLETFIKTKST
ncbi:EAL domain-containing protein [Thiomicrorhabdus sp. Milos-T2]|uniref:bifunctional diguanylate cyclase/phosphodiesterase n=1 Tax=Thiomicrorhabdus sp. Milos-T2 TaxID=90814 RepID=UPI0004948448|nr:EAL domain-containing protein [Thiomicrorhabdus sp. Milos-T2]